MQRKKNAVLSRDFHSYSIHAAISSQNRVSVRPKRLYRENPDVYKGKTPVVFADLFSNDRWPMPISRVYPDGQ